MWQLLLLSVLTLVQTDDLPPTCSKPVYCDSLLLKHVQLARIFNDSKTFVDLEMRNDPNTTLEAFDKLLAETNNNPTKDNLTDFVDQYFDDVNQLEDWMPEDYTEEPAFLNTIQDKDLKEFAKAINALWPVLGRKVNPEVFEKPDRFSLVPVSHGFIIPGGRFRELYYWDTYWIIEGLLISGMQETAKGVIENLIELLNIFGHIPNGGRWYYQRRSQPPLLSAMVSLYFRHTNDTEFLRANIDALEKELNYWLDTQIVSFDKDGQTYTLLRYFAPSSGPRPESYYEDYMDAQTFDTEERKTKFYVEVKSAAESGWDFSSRWLGIFGGNTGNLTTIHTTNVIPVDLNAIFASALKNIANFNSVLNKPREASIWSYRAKQWRSSIEEVLWDEDDGVWYDYDMGLKQHRKYFYPSNIAPLWVGAVEEHLVKKHGPRVLEYLRKSQGLDFPGGVPASLIRSGEQWDFPNAWPPLVSIVVNALEAINIDDAQKLAFHVAQTWVRACHIGFLEHGQMFEKYDAEMPGRYGGGGEYTVQSGFGWSNGVILEFVVKYAEKLTAKDEYGENWNPDSEGSTSHAGGTLQPSSLLMKIGCFLISIISLVFHSDLSFSSARIWDLNNLYIFKFIHSLFKYCKLS